jgi:hypothetical protein
VRAEAGYEILKALDATAAYIFQTKFYNSDFAYRDLDIHGVELGGAWRPTRALRLWSTYDFERALADGSDMADTILDVSYDSWSFLFGIRHYMTILDGISPEIYGSFQFQNFKFQTDRIPDIRRRHLYYYGREDNNYLIKSGLSWQIPFQIRTSLEYAFIQKDASLPDIYPDMSHNVPETTAELEHKLNYKSNSVTVRFSRQF